MSISINVTKGEITGVSRDETALTRQHWDDGVVTGNIQNVQLFEMVRFKLNNEEFKWWWKWWPCWWWSIPFPIDDESESFAVHFDDDGAVAYITAAGGKVTKHAFELDDTAPLPGELGVIWPAGLIKVEDEGSVRWGVFDRTGYLWINEA